MNIVNSDKFDELSNQAINEAIRIANKLKCGEINCSHLFLALISRSKELRSYYQEVTNKTLNDFAEALETQCVRGTYGRFTSEYENDSLEIESMSKSMSRVLTNAVVKAAKNQERVSGRQLFEELLHNPNTEVAETFSVMGIAIGSIKTLIEKDPLSDMPITRNFAMDMNNYAESHGYDVVEARDDELSDIIEILGRRKKNNPCLIGEPGVGKTAIVEGLAQRINEGNVPEYLKDKHIISVDISGIVSGTRYRGEFEERLNGILYEASSHKNVILFFDEFHMIMGAGSVSSENPMNAANIIKPAIVNGDVCIIGATTIKEYRNFIENDGAFERRIQSVLIKEPSVEQAYKMVSKVIDSYCQFHNCTISDDVIEAAVNMSDRYITDKKLPDKAISVIDQTAARLKANSTEAKELIISSKDIQETVSKITGIDARDLDENSKNKLQDLDEKLSKRVIGQDAAISTVVKAIRRSKAGIKDPNRPIGSFLFVGPTGVGKTELTKALAIEFSGGIKNMIRFDMSEYMEKHSVSKLVGSPPGYVGYGEGGQLTEAVRHNKNSVVLFDEIEKAHPDVFNILLQVLDDGQLTDSKGVKVDFKNSIIIMTSNAGYGKEDGLSGKIGFGEKAKDTEDSSETEKKALKALESTFRPEFLNRLDKIVVFNSLGEEECKKIVRLELDKISDRLKSKKIRIIWGDSLVDYIAKEGFSDKYGARNIKRKIQDCVEDTLADQIINGDIVQGSHINVTYSAANKSIEIAKVISLDDKLQESLRENGELKDEEVNENFSYDASYCSDSNLSNSSK